MATNKYRNRKVSRYGKTFDSMKEARRYAELMLLEKAGEISELRTQVRFVLIPTQYEQKWDSRLNVTVKGKLIERECSYVADFVYRDKDGLTVVEDTKGYKTKDYIIKRKLLLFRYGIRIREV